MKPKHVKDEVAIWDRTAIHATAESKTIMTRVTIESPGEKEKVVCDGARGFLTDHVVRYLQDPALTS